MKKLSIYEVYVLMQDQEQCDRMKQLCIDNGLPYTKLKSLFMFYGGDYFYYSGFFQIGHSPYKQTQVTEQEFIELLKERKNAEKTNS